MAWESVCLNWCLDAMHFALMQVDAIPDKLEGTINEVITEIHRDRNFILESKIKMLEKHFWMVLHVSGPPENSMKELKSD